MWRAMLFLVAVAAAALGVGWFLEQPGTLTLRWLGYEVETSVFAAMVVLAGLVVVILAAWGLLRYLFTRPAAWRAGLRRRRDQRGREALSRGLIAVGAGDKDEARRGADTAGKLIPGEPLTALLRAQAAQLHGDRAAARQAFESMAEAPETELLGLRGLFLEAKRENETEAARQFAERAMRRNPDLAWSVNALFEMQCRAGDWEGALRTLDVARRQKQVDRQTADRRRAVLLTARAREAEDDDPAKAQELALEAHKLAPALVPAAAIAGRVLASQGDGTRAARIIAKTWEMSPNPELAVAYAHSRPGEGPRERLERVKFLARWTPENIEAAVAVANAAVEARAWEEARDALQPFLSGRPTARVCTLMARIESGETGDQGRVREWLARAVRAPRDPAWTADGYVSEDWLPVSPITGTLDAFEWKVPVELLGSPEGPLVIEDEAATRPEAPSASLSAPPAAEGEERAETSETESPPPAESPAESEEKPRGGAQGETAAEEPEIYVPPRAPDDPGPEPEETDEESQGQQPYPPPPR